MSGPDDEIDDFLARRRPLFRRAPDDLLEPPEDLDRIVLRQAREAIEADRPQRVFHGPRWSAPLAIAATLVLAITVILQATTSKQAPRPEVTVQHIAQQLDSPPPAAAPSEAPAADAAANERVSGDAVVVEIAPLFAARDGSARSPGFVAQDEATRHAPPAPPPPVASGARSAGQAPASRGSVHGPVADVTVESSSVMPPSEAESAVASASSTPAWRRNAQTWRAQIERLRAEGRNAEADAEQAEYKRQHRAYAADPQR
jgi:hypothetical protein